MKKPVTFNQGERQTFAPVPMHVIPEQGHMYDFTCIVNWLVESGISEKDLFNEEYNKWLQNEISSAQMNPEFKELALACLRLFVTP